MEKRLRKGGSLASRKILCTSSSHSSALVALDIQGARRKKDLCSNDLNELNIRYNR